MAKKKVLSEEIRLGRLPNPYIIQAADVGHLIDWGGFGHVLPHDVGRKIRRELWGMTIETSEQMQKRLDRQPHIVL